MTEYKKKFIPVCFKKDLSKFNELFVKQKEKNEKVISLQIPVNSQMSARDVYTIIKNLDLSIKNCQEIEYSKERLNLVQASKVFRISKNCDVYNIKTRTKFLKFFSLEKNFKLIRFYSFSSVYNCYFFFFQVVDEKNDKVKYCRGGVVIPVQEKKIFVYLKRSKNLSSKYHQYYFELLISNCRVVLDVMGSCISKEDVERLSTVETFETEAESENRKDECELIKFADSRGMSEDNYEDGKDGSSDEGDVTMGDELVEWGDVNLDLIEKDADSLWRIKIEEEIELSKPKFIIDENDEDYRMVRKLTVDDLKRLNLYEPYCQLKTEIAEDIEKYNISENEIIRYIYGWRGDVVNVKKTIVDLQLWRNEFKPRSLTFDDFSNVDYDLKNLLHVACQDIYGRPLLLMKGRYFIPKNLDVDVYLKYLIFNVEQAISLMPDNVDKIAIIVDIKDAGLDNFSSAHMKAVRELTSKFFVERLSSIIIINKSFFFGMMWSVVSKFFDERMKKKMVVIDNSKMPWLKRILGDNYDKIFTN